MAVQDDLMMELGVSKTTVYRDYRRCLERLVARVQGDVRPVDRADYLARVRALQVRCEEAGRHSANVAALMLEARVCGYVSPTQVEVVQHEPVTLNLPLGLDAGPYGPPMTDVVDKTEREDDEEE